MSSRIEKIFSALGQTKALSSIQRYSASNLQRSSEQLNLNCNHSDNQLQLNTPVEKEAHKQLDKQFMDAFSIIQQAEVVFIDSDGKLQYR